MLWALPRPADLELQPWHQVEERIGQLRIELLAAQRLDLAERFVDRLEEFAGEALGSVNAGGVVHPVADEGQGVEPAGGQLGVHSLGADGQPPGHLQGLGLLAAAPGHVVPLVRKGAAHAGEHPLADQVADRPFHDSPGGGGGEKHQLPRGQQRLEPGLDADVEIFHPPCGSDLFEIGVVHPLIFQHLEDKRLADNVCLLKGRKACLVKHLLFLRVGVEHVTANDCQREDRNKCKQELRR